MKSDLMLTRWRDDPGKTTEELNRFEKNVRPVLFSMMEFDLDEITFSLQLCVRKWGPSSVTTQAFSTCSILRIHGTFACTEKP